MSSAVRNEAERGVHDASGQVNPLPVAAVAAAQGTELKTFLHMKK